MAATRGLLFSGKIKGLFSHVNKLVTLRACRYASFKAQALVYDECGDPGKVLRLDFVDRDEIGPESIGVHMIAAPINPSDVNQIQGTYALKPKLPAVGGNEGFGRVVKVGKEVKGFEEGDFVILAESALGSTVIQNGANSGVGRAVIQLAAAWGIQTINVVRDRPNLEDLQKELTTLGATHVVTEEFCRTPEMTQLMKDLPKPTLGLNCVGGKSATELTRRLSPGGTLVTYGGMSRKPFAVPTGQLIFSDIRIRGFWMTGWNTHNPK
ncbi:hypothetical protein QZH41_015620, partial [Actinostola sp. cb2023]